MNNANPQTVAVHMLVDNHTHAGKPVAKGDVIQVPSHVAERLVTRKLGERTTTTGGKSAAAKE